MKRLQPLLAFLLLVASSCVSVFSLLFLARLCSLVWSIAP